MKIEIQVLGTADDKFFFCGGHRYNVIKCVQELEGNGSLAVFRGDNLLDETDYVSPCGAHDEGSAFRGLGKLAQETLLPNGTGASFLTPDNFKSGDRIIITSSHALSDEVVEQLLCKDDRLVQIVRKGLARRRTQ